MHRLSHVAKFASRTRLTRLSPRICVHRSYATTSPGNQHVTATSISGTETKSAIGATKPVASPTKVEKLILDTIKATGPMSFSEYMWMCLAHPTEGYYTKPLHDVLGAKGDFITSPEISQVFGELMGIWLLSQWLASGKTCPLRIVELGPGTGTLMDDVLRVLSQFSAAKSAVQEIHLVETSRTLRELQEKKLHPIVSQNGWKIHWHDSIDDVPRSESQYTMLVAHEFFDALPFHLIEKTEKGWTEVLITSEQDPAAPKIIIPSTSTVQSSLPSKTRLRPQPAPEPTAKSVLLGKSSPRFDSLPIGSRVEASQVSFRLARKVAELLSTKDNEKGVGGSALIIDYGDERAFGNSFRAFKDHKIVDVFQTPGDCDLTVNVDFAYLKEAMKDLVLTHGCLTQAEFLTRMGIEVRVDALKRSAKDDDRKSDIDRAAKRLVDQTGMGTQYKVLGLTSSVDPSSPSAEEVWPFMKVKID